MTVGRPTKYRPEYAEECIKVMGEGFSLTAFAGSIGVSRETVYEWERTNPDFSDAIKSARAARVFALEKQMLTGETGPGVTARIFALKNACPEEWRDKHNLELTGKDGGPIETKGDQAVTIETARKVAFLLERGRRALEGK